MNTKIRWSLLALLLASCFLSVGCATTVRGTRTSIPVTSSPSGARVYRDNGAFVGQTPCQVTLRNNGEHRVAVVNEAGDKVFVATAKPGVHGWSVVGTVFMVGTGFPGLVGVPIDAVSGGNAKLSINSVFADFDNMEPNMRPPSAMATRMAASTNTIPAPLTGLRPVAPLKPPGPPSTPSHPLLYKAP